MELSQFDRRPVVVAIAGPNGAGKTTFFYSHLAPAGLRFVNADALAAEIGVGPYEAARLANALRRELLRMGESFVFETVFSDPVGDKVAFLEEAACAGYTVVVCFIGLSSPEQSIERVAMRVSQGGHDVPDNKLRDRFSRTLANLKAAIARLPHILVFDNSDLNLPYRLVAVFDQGKLLQTHERLPDWFQQAIAGR
jgi:predicted ABC-type ATPase